MEDPRSRTQDCKERIQSGNQGGGNLGVFTGSKISIPRLLASVMQAPVLDKADPRWSNFSELKQMCMVSVPYLFCSPVTVAKAEATDRGAQRCPKL